MIINQQIIITTITRNLSIVERTINPPHWKSNIICYVCGRKGHKAFESKNRRQSGFCHNIRTYSKGQTYFFALEYDIVSDKTNLLVDCGAINLVITDKSKFINSDQNFKPGNHFVKLADGNWANNIMLKRGGICIYLCNSKGHMCRCILKNALYVPTFKQNIFSVQEVTENGAHISFERDNCQLIYPNGIVFNITHRASICIIWKISFLPEMPLMTYILGIKS